jgi:pimeloyl-ACP methyl ester carboxylesterase
MTESLDYEARLSVTGKGRPLLMISGMDGTGQLFYRQVPRLERDYRVATYALRDEADRMEVLVEDLVRIHELATPTEEPAVVVGESFGGTVALSFALAHPKRVGELVVLNSFPRFLPQTRLRFAILAVRLAPWNVMPLVRRVTALRLHSSHTRPEDIRRFLAVTRATTRLGYLNRLRILQRLDLRDRLHEIQAPVLFLAAAQDHLVPSVEQAVLMADRVPDATLRVLDGHGHICLIAPDLDLRAILEEWRARRRPPSAAPTVHEGERP